MITKSKVTEIFVLPMISAKNLMQRWQKTLFNQRLMSQYGAQNEAYMSRSAEKWVRGLCFNELGVCG